MLRQFLVPFIEFVKNNRDVKNTFLFWIQTPPPILETNFYEPKGSNTLYKPIVPIRDVDVLIISCGISME